MSPVQTAVALRLLLPAVAMAAACASPVEPACSSDPDVIVAEADLIPRFSWSGDCGVTHLTVVRTATDQAVWSLVALDERTPFGSPVRYGSDVAGTEEAVAATALQPGGTYRVEIRMIVGGDGIGASGFAVFIHQPQ